MPRLPTAEDLGTRIARPTRGVVSIAPDPMGGAISGVAGGIGKIVDEETQKLEELAAQDALNTLERKRLEMTYDPEKGFSNVTGSAVLNRPLLKEVPEAFDNEIKTLSAGLKTKRAQQYFQQRAAGVKNGITGDLFRHVALQTDKAHEATEQATIDLQADIAAKDPTRLDGALAIAGETAAKAIARLRLDPSKDSAQISMLTQRAQGKVVTAALKSILSADTVDVTAATELLNRHESVIPSDALVVMKEAVRKADVSQTTGAYVRDLLFDGALSRGDAGKRIESEFGKDPDKLKAARMELAYQFDERERAKRENEDRLLNPVNTLIGDALNSGRPIGKPERDRVLSSLRTESPEIYAKAAGAIDQHNDEIRSERRAAESHYRAMVESSPDARLAGLAMKYDMLTNPGKYKTVDLKTTLFPLVKAGKMKAGDVEELMGLQAKLRDPSSRGEMVTLMTGGEYLDSRLRGVTVNGTKYVDLDKDRQREIKDRALAIADPLLQNLQAGGTKASKDDVKRVVDSLFVERRYRDTFLGIEGGIKSEIKIDEEGAPVRATYSQIPVATRTRIEAALRKSGITPTQATVIEYFNAGN